MRKIIKRDGRVVGFNDNKITIAMKKAAEDAKYEISKEKLEELTDDVIKHLEESYDFKDNKPTVENIQDIVERTLTENNMYEVVKAYILYREDRARKRDRESNLMKLYDDLTFGSSRDVDLKRENGNINGETAMGKMLRYGSEGAKQYAHLYLMDEDISKAHQRGDIHIHDLDFLSTGTLTCQTKDTYITLKDEKGKIINTMVDFFDKNFSENNNVSPEIFSPKNYYILGRNGWTKLEAISRRMIGAKEPVYFLKTKKGLGLKLTGNHRLPIIRDNKELLLRVDEIKEGDELLSDNRDSNHSEKIRFIRSQIISIENYDYNDYVYDITTAEHWYIANGYVSHNCDQLPLDKLFEKGFNTGEGFIRTPNSIQSYASLACVILQGNQNEQHGGLFV